MRWVLVTMLATSTANAAPTTLVGEVDYHFVDKNGMGWVTLEGKVTATLTFAGKDGSLKITGQRKFKDALLVEGKTGKSPDMRVQKHDRPVEEAYPIHDVAVSGTTITFKLDPLHDHVTATCVPAKVPGIARGTLYECTITGFKWRAAGATLPEIHHPIILDGNLKAKTRILNTFTGETKSGFGKRTVTEAKPAKKP